MTDAGMVCTFHAAMTSFVEAEHASDHDERKQATGVDGGRNNLFSASEPNSFGCIFHFSYLKVG